MQKTRNLLVTIALAIAAAVICSGCPALMIPGLAYSGYQYAHKDKQPEGTPSSTGSTNSTAAEKKKSKVAQTAKSSTPPPPQKIPDSEIE